MKTETNTIGGFKYSMEQVGTEDGEQIVLRLARPLAGLLSRAASKGLKEANVTTLLATGLGPALAQLKGSDLRFVRTKLAAKTKVWIKDGKVERAWSLGEPDNLYDGHFAGRYPEMLQWLYWGLRFNRFFGEGLDRLGAMAVAAMAEMSKAKADKSPSPPAPAPGGHGASSSASTEAHA
jgi:tail assembly chaperone